MYIALRGVHVCVPLFISPPLSPSLSLSLSGMAMATDLPSSFESQSCMRIAGYDMSKAAAEKVQRERERERERHTHTHTHTREPELHAHCWIRHEQGCC